MICPCYKYGKMVEKLGEGSSTLNCIKFLICMPFCGGCIIHKDVRAKIRGKYALQVRAHRSVS
jgi:hypothetical protein